jgi:hypothetical protein
MPKTQLLRRNSKERKSGRQFLKGTTVGENHLSGTQMLKRI